MTQHPDTGFDLAEIDRLMTTTKQVRQRLDLTRPVPYDVLLECIEIAGFAPMGGNLERNRWMIIDDPATKAAIAERYAETGRPYLAANAAIRVDDRSQRIIDSASFLVEHLAEVPALVLAMRLDRPPMESQGALAAYYGSVLPGVWSFQLAVAPEESGRPGRRCISITRMPSPSCSAYLLPSRRCASWRSATTPAPRSVPRHVARRRK